MKNKTSIIEQVKSELKDCRYHADCMALKIKIFRKYDKYLNIFLTITSSGGVTSWILNNNWGVYCGGIIALSQLITALKPIFPFSKHIHTLNTRCYKQEALFLELSNLWFELQDDSIDVDIAKTRLSYLKQRISENEFFDDDDGFEFSDEILKKAQYMTADTIKTKFNITD